ncbi:MAG: coenzyme F420 hydrogenase [Anaerolineaceae bacterium]|nr:coenzyme F420 hydrogenase [Anaerolineaceae bacterium]
MEFNSLIDRITKRTWTDLLIKKYIGLFNSSWLLYAKDEITRNHAASGGVITAILKYMLETGKIDGALVLISSVNGNNVNCDYQIITDPDELPKAQGSKYFTTNFTHDAVPLIEAFEGNLALVLLPCDTWVINRLRKNNPKLNQKIKLTIALFCGHISDPALTQLVIKKNKPAGKSLTDFRYRAGHWRGKMHFSYEDDIHNEKPFSVFSDYQNLYFYCARKCLRCNDHTGYDCDLSIGDVWLMAMKNNPIKHNAVIARTTFANDLIVQALSENILEGKPVSIETIADAQSRSLPLHYNVSARSKAGKLLGIKIADTVNEKVRLVDLLIAFVILFNYKLSNTAKGRKLIARTPKKIIKLYLYFLKALEIL